jgi:hypothetical protein
MVNTSTNINKTKESLNSDGQHFHPYQQGLSIFFKSTSTSLFTGGTFFLLKFEQFS